MSILPQTPTPAYPGRRWEARQYPGVLAASPVFRSDLRLDLASLAGAPSQIRDDVELCASEAFANAVLHSRSHRRGGTVMRLLSTPVVMGHQTTLRLSVLDDGPMDTRPMVPAQRSVQEWEESESGRGLLLIHQLATEWGTQRWADPDTGDVLGAVLWAEFTYPVPAARRRQACVCGGA
ncbi:hypothetical protein GCM10007079_05540 [Nocardiopsis terrae]|uniref:Anti-sigma regulatory factor (Ser/Thr protein kinase) n=1 Tax=Nocardiopsis terrae TaxID=372655 RepID=A0ABR9HNR3_9ACTN|nr:ATP-binding protein [Nocardiopsis terrae]MBE1460603.1 anti-sigma regulatory factor (Ser/Thr protein kinase) [Nocardiopsis terrae]GHC72374.1 hypothetical protein GCM10007079_05540 [Nocardiopsis terrae]